MAGGNPDKLIPFRNAEIARERGSVGGRKSGQARRLKRSLRERLQLILEGKCGATEVADMVALAIIEKALTGDVRAFEVIRDSIGEKPSEKAEIQAGETLRIVWEE